MSKLRRLRPGVFLLSLFLVIVLLVAGQGPPGLVQAAEVDFRDFACWASGSFPTDDYDDSNVSLEPEWGKDADEFAVDERDLRGDVRLDMDLKADYLGSPHDPPIDSAREPDVVPGTTPDRSLADSDSSLVYRPMEQPVYTLFNSIPEMVEYAFALDVFVGGDRSILDRRVKRLGLALNAFSAAEYPIGDGTWQSYVDEDRRYLLPWADITEYLDRRRVANPQNDAVRSFYAQWIDPANPEGGRAPDLVALARDDAANRLEALEGTFSAAGDGGVVHYGTMEAVGQEFTFQADENCGNLGVCNGIVQVSSSPVPVTLHVNIREQNDGQTYRSTTGTGDRRVVVSKSVDGITGVVTKTINTVPFDLGEIPPSTLRLRDPSTGGYYRRHQENTGADQLFVTLVLRNEYRRDLNFDPDSGSVYGERGLPVMGIDPWTYDRIGTARDPDLNEWFRVVVHGIDPNLVHDGYRQPQLSRAYPHAGSLTRDNSDHIEWPVNLEDVNWYLYRLPSTGYRDPLWLYWVSKEGRERVVSSAYGHDPVPFPRDGDLSSLSPAEVLVVPDCSLPGDDFDASVYGRGSPLNIESIKCSGLGADWEWNKVWKGERQGVNLPFDSPSTSDDDLLGPDLLVKQGVESAVDSWDPVGTRQLDRFEFLIYESERMGDSAASGKGYDAERRYGIPQDDAKERDHVDEWAFQEVDPNMPHLLVFTFYEAMIDDELVDFKVGDAGSEVQSFSLPKRRIQRVVCRMLVHPSGNWPTLGSIKRMIVSVFDTFKNFLTEQLDVLKGWIEAILKSIYESPRDVIERAAEVTCAGMAKLDQLVLNEVPGGSTLVDSEGRARTNAAAESRAEGFERCHRVSRPPVSTCDRSADAVFEGQCLELPELRMRVRNAEFIDPPGPGLPYREYSLRTPGRLRSPNFGERGASSKKSTGEGFEPKFLPAANPLASPLPVLTGRNVGLTRVFVDWDFRWDTVSPDIHDVIEGYTVYVHPDPKSAPAPVPESGWAFNLPKLVEVKTPPDFVGDPHSYEHRRIRGFSVGGLNRYDSDSSLARPGSDSLVSLPVENVDTEKNPVGSSRVRAEYESFNNYIHNMPLAPGFVHGFEVRPYVGSPGESDFRLGPKSERLLLRGDDVACDHLSGVDVEDIHRLYDCGPRSPAGMGYEDDEFRPGLLALTGTDICRDIFSSTPAKFTWDNPVVKQVWWLVWIIAGGVLFTLLVWQGLRMTYDIWLDPQPATGFRELVPRFLLSVALAASSLVICRMVLVLASDLTCFVAQYTGMSMWGVIGATFANLGIGIAAWFMGLFTLEDGVMGILNSFALLFFTGTMITIVFLCVLFIFFKVMLGMLIRLGLLAVLVALSPLAFAFYASDATAHWTKKWVSMFLGATFQQVVVLVVIYIGIGIMGDFLKSGAEYGMQAMVVGMILAFLTLALADAVPGIVNPGGKGLFGAYSQMIGMAAAGAMVVASGGASAIAGGIAAARGGAAAAAAPAAAAPASPGVGISTTPGAPGSPPGAPSAGGLVSSVSRGPVGPSAQGAGAPGAPSSVAPGSVAPGSVAPGSVAPGSVAPGSVAPGSVAPVTGPVALSTVPLPGVQAGSQPSGLQAAGAQPDPQAGVQPDPQAGVQPSGSQPGSQPGSQSVQPGARPGFQSGVQPGAQSGAQSAPQASSQPGVQLGAQTGIPAPGTPAPGAPASGPVAISTVPQAAPAVAPAVAPSAGAGGLLSRVGGGMASGFVRGARFGARMNTRIADVTAGNAFYSHSSRGDDAAMQAQQRREEETQDRALTRNSYNRMSDIMSRLEDRLQDPGGP